MKPNIFGAGRNRRHGDDNYDCRNGNGRNQRGSNSSLRTVCFIFLGSFFMSLNTIFLTRLTANTVPLPNNMVAMMTETSEGRTGSWSNLYDWQQLPENLATKTVDQEQQQQQQPIEQQRRADETQNKNVVTSPMHTEVRPDKKNGSNPPPSPSDANDADIANTVAFATAVSTPVPTRKSVHVVVSHCDQSIQWIWKQYLKDIPNHDYHIKSVTILTKCGNVIPAQDLPADLPEPLPTIQVVTLPNVGRCDHSYAYWITQILHGGKAAPMLKAASTQRKLVRKRKDKNKAGLVYVHFTDDVPFQRIADSIEKDDLVLFLKDNNNAYRTNMEKTIEVVDMFRAISPTNSDTDMRSVRPKFLPDEIPNTNSHGLACRSFTNKKLRGVRPRKYQVTDWAHRSVLWTFVLGGYARQQKKIKNEKLRKRSNQDFVSAYRPMGNWITYLSTHGGNASAATGATSQQIVDVATARRRLRNQQQQQQQPQPPNKDQDKDGSRLPPVFSRDYWEHGIRSTTVEHGYYYNFTHEGLEFPVDEADPSRKLQPSLTHSVTQRYRHNDVIPTCFGGVFATQWGQISSDDAPITPHGWSVITNELSRADNIEEGHYMERWWADLLSWSTYASSRQQEWARQLEGANASPTPGPSSAGTSAATSDATTAATSTWEEATAAVARERAEKERTTEYTTANEELHLSSLNQKEQLEFLDHKLLHWTSPDSYTGLIVLDSSTFGNENRPLQFHDEGPPGDKPPPAENQNQGNSGKRRRRKKQ